jgi:4-amino-4-deoxy-L-arabinose transferase-like glycosyltransferase
MYNAAFPCALNMSNPTRMISRYRVFDWKSPATTRWLSRLFTRDLVLPVVLLAGLVCLHLWALMRTPAPFEDEAWYADRGRAMILTGHGFGTLDSTPFTQYPGAANYFGFIGPLIQSLPMRVLGVNLFSIRISSLLIGILLLLVVFNLALRLYNRRIALCAVAVGGLSAPFLLSAHLGREDILVALLGFGAISLYLGAGDRFSWRAVGSGLLLGLGFEVHPIAAVYLITVLCMLLWDYRIRFFRVAKSWCVALGVALGGAFYIAQHVLPDPQTYSLMTRVQNVLPQTPPLLTLDLGTWYDSLVGTLWMSGTLMLPVLLIALLTLAQRMSASDRRLIVIFLCLLLSFTALVLNKPDHYAIVLAPIVWLITGAALDVLSGRIQQRERALPVYVSVVLLGSFLVAAIMTTLSSMAPDPTDDFDTTLSTINRVLPSDSKPVGLPTWWFARPEAEYINWSSLWSYRTLRPDRSLAESIGDLGATHLILDQRLEEIIAIVPLYRVLGVSDIDPKIYGTSEDVNSFITDCTRMLTEVSTQTFGAVRVYEIKPCADTR